MIRRQFAASVGLWAVVLALGCGANGGTPGDLTSTVDKAPDAIDSGIAAGSDGTKRQDGYVCKNPPPPAAPSKLAHVPAGPFLMGCNPKYDTECRRDELPTHTVTLKAYDIDVTEVSQLQYYECVKAKACAPPICDWDPCGIRAD